MGIFGVIMTMLYGAIGLSWSRTQRQVDNIEEAVKKFVPREDIDAVYARAERLRSLELTVAELASRRELMAHMEHIAEDRRSQAATVKASFLELKETIETNESHSQEFRHEMRSAIHKLAMEAQRIATIQDERAKRAERRGQG